MLGVTICVVCSASSLVMGSELARTEVTNADFKELAKVTDGIAARAEIGHLNALRIVEKARR